MDYVNPSELVDNLSEAGKNKTELKLLKILIKGILSGAFLGYATTLAYTGATQTGWDIIGALIFPTGFVMVLLLNLELVTSSFALIPLAVMRKKAAMLPMFRNFLWGFTGNLLGSLLYAFMFVIYITKYGHVDISTSLLAQKIIAVAEGKTLVYKELGGDGYIVMFVKALLCNWMVTMGAVMAFTSKSTIGKIAAIWLPIFIFFAHGYEHAVVNMFVIPTGMMLGADISFSDWWVWNQIVVTIGNLTAGVIFTAFPLYYITKK
ncbi:MAG: formate/nitrite transporter family protein [Brumimicrobium sp.]|nr:formate/nitrite transporter family protein [Brumimicrobium sp.]MCO5268814.1 formate/nitrite transporter family protein [Brumimicrobium sp.]